MNVRSDRSMLGRTAPHSEQVFVLGNQRSTFSMEIPSHPHLYSILAMKAASEASARARARRRFFIIPDTFRVSTTTLPTGVAVIADAALWWASFLMFLTRACAVSLSRYLRSLRLLCWFLPWVFLDRAMDLSSRRNRPRAFRRDLGLSAVQNMAYNSIVWTLLASASA